jgi:hypothetical protein
MLFATKAIGSSVSQLYWFHIALASLPRRRLPFRTRWSFHAGSTGAEGSRSAE